MRGRAANPPRTASSTLKSIFEFCDAHSISQRDLAEKINSKQPTINQYRAGRSAPSIIVVEEICAALGLEISIRHSETSK